MEPLVGRCHRPRLSLRRQGPVYVRSEPRAVGRQEAFQPRAHLPFPGIGRRAGRAGGTAAQAEQLTPELTARLYFEQS